MPTNCCTIHPVCSLPKPRKQKETNKITSSLWVKKKEGKHAWIEFLFFTTLFTHSAGVRVYLHVFLPQFLSQSFSLCFSFSLVLSLCGILAAILALGSHLSFGGTHAFLLADGTPTHTNSHTHMHARALAKLTLSHTHTDPMVLKIKKTYRGYAMLTEWR